LILTGAALHGASATTTLMLFAYAAGAAAALGLALFAGGRVFSALKRSAPAATWARRILGVAVLAGVALAANGTGSRWLASLSAPQTASVEDRLLSLLPKSPPNPGSPPAMAQDTSDHAPAMMMMKKRDSSAPLEIEGPLPDLSGATAWLNSPPLTAAELRGKVVLIDFWTYSCINCLRSLPYLRQWAEQYKSQGLVVIGVHSPEFAFEKDLSNVKKAVEDLHITYPVAVDSDYAIWRAFNNQYWPAHYFIDVHGNIRFHHFGEGGYAESQRVIEQLLAERQPGGAKMPPPAATAAGGVEAAADLDEVGSPETYIGYERAENFVSGGGVQKDEPHRYSAPALHLNEWALTGEWAVHAEHATLIQPDGSIVYRFHARDLHLVLSPGDSKMPIPFRITIDGHPPGASHGLDVDAEGNGTVREQRLYQLIRQSGPIEDRTFEIHFLRPQIQAYAFTFG
jgi:thiol-disulfide isomerase/thioredoxin